MLTYTTYHYYYNNNNYELRDTNNYRYYTNLIDIIPL